MVIRERYRGSGGAASSPMRPLAAILSLDDFGSRAVRAHATVAGVATQTRCTQVQNWENSTRAAGQLLDALVEGLRGEFQTLDHREVGEQLGGELLHGHSSVDR